MVPPARPAAQTVGHVTGWQPPPQPPRLPWPPAHAAAARPVPRGAVAPTPLQPRVWWWQPQEDDPGGRVPAAGSRAACARQARCLPAVRRIARRPCAWQPSGVPGPAAAGAAPAGGSAGVREVDRMSAGASWRTRRRQQLALPTSVHRLNTLLGCLCTPLHPSMSTPPCANTRGWLGRKSQAAGLSASAQAHAWHQTPASMPRCDDNHAAAPLASAHSRASPAEGVQQGATGRPTWAHAGAGRSGRHLLLAAAANATRLAVVLGARHRLTGRCAGHMSGRPSTSLRGWSVRSIGAAPP